MHRASKPRAEQNVASPGVVHEIGISKTCLRLISPAQAKILDAINQPRTRKRLGMLIGERVGLLQVVVYRSEDILVLI